MRKGNLAHSLKANPISSLDCHVRPTCTWWIASENGAVLRYISRCSAPTNSTVLERKGVGGRGGRRAFCRARAFLEIAIPQFRGGTCLACFLPRRLRNCLKKGSVL